MGLTCTRCHLRPKRPGQAWCPDCFVEFGRKRRDARRRGVLQPISVTHKRCYACGEDKPRNAFGYSSGRADGLSHICRICVCVRDKARRRGEAWHVPAKTESAPLVLSPGIAGYVAGLLDGEGTIRLTVVNGYLLSPEIHVSNTYLPVLEWLRETLGTGGIAVMHHSTERRRQTYRWIVKSRRALPVVATALPYLIIKHRHAEVILAFYAAVPEYKRQSPGALYLPLREPLASLYAELRALNRRGPHP